ncbi:hypothetical protein Mal65_02730 [Crateriforma conspicua]|nr:hypothetical protein Mal65_02730 [Crateriforma conspicua]
MGFGPKSFSKTHCFIRKSTTVLLTRDLFRHHRFDAIPRPGMATTFVLRNWLATLRSLHRDAANANAVFQFASQFNCLERAAPHVIPEGGVGIYQNDRTQGPVCSVCAGAGTIYLTLVGGGVFGNRLDTVIHPSNAWIVCVGRPRRLHCQLWFIEIRSGGFSRTSEFRLIGWDPSHEVRRCKWQVLRHFLIAVGFFRANNFVHRSPDCTVGLNESSTCRNW